MRNFSRLPLYFLLLFFSTLYLGVFAVPVQADNTGFLSLINTYRQQNNLGTLTEDQNLTNAACWLSGDMGINNYFDHIDSLGRDMSKRLSDFGVSGGYRAENIYYTTSSSSANSAFDAWKNSPGHNTNMLGANYTRIGIGRVLVNSRWYWTTDFASGTAVTLTSQCSSSSSPSASPPSSSKKSKTTPPPPAPIPVSLAEPNVVPIPATESAKVDITNQASQSATIAAKVIKIDDQVKKDATDPVVLVKDSFLVANFIFYVLFFGFIFYQLWHHFRLPAKEHGEI